VDRRHGLPPCCALEEKPGDLPGCLPVQRAFGRQQWDHDAGIQRAVDPHRQLARKLALLDLKW